MTRSLYNGLLAFQAWAAPAFVGSILVSEWNTPGRVPLLALFALCVAYRAWVRIGTMSLLDQSRFRFERMRRARVYELSDIACVAASGWAPDGTGLFIVLRPVFRQPVLLVSASEDILRPWARAGVRVVGLSKRVLAAEDQADEFFSREDEG